MTARSLHNRPGVRDGHARPPGRRSTACAGRPPSFLDRYGRSSIGQGCLLGSVGWSGGCGPCGTALRWQLGPRRPSSFQIAGSAPSAATAAIGTWCRPVTTAGPHRRESPALVWARPGQPSLNGQGPPRALGPTANDALIAGGRPSIWCPVIGATNRRPSSLVERPSVRGSAPDRLPRARHRPQPRVPHRGGPPPCRPQPWSSDL